MVIDTHTHAKFIKPGKITSNFMKDNKTCKVCNEVKDKIFLKRGGNNTNIYVDSSQRQWHGRTCPDCHLKKKNESYVIKKDKNLGKTP